MKAQIQFGQMLDARSAVFADVDRRFRESDDMLFVMDDGAVKGIITKRDYLCAYYGGIDVRNFAADISNKHFTFINENELSEAENILINKGLQQIPVIGADGLPKWVYIRTNYAEGQRFYCGVLAGLSKYNFSINADLSVSCHCVLRGMGGLGDMKKQTLFECFKSERANYFRKLLYDGCIPTVKCLSCPELTAAPNAVAKYYLKNYSLPKAVMLENTSVCNLRCKNCYNAVIEKATLSLADTEIIARQLADADVEIISMFKYGEPFADRQIGEKIDVLRTHMPNVLLQTSTNGMLIDTPGAIQAALKFDYLAVSLDGVDEESASEFQVGISFEKVCSNMKQLVDARNERGLTFPVIAWKNVLFAWNTGRLENAFCKALELGVDKLEFVDGWNVKDKEKARAVRYDESFLTYMEQFEWRYSHAGGGTYTFDLKKPKLC